MIRTGSLPRLETSANVQTTEVVYAADDTQTAETRSVGVRYWDFTWIPQLPRDFTCARQAVATSRKHVYTAECEQAP